MKESKSKTVTIKIRKEDVKNAESLKAYLVNQDGEVIESVSLKGGNIPLKSKASEIHGKTKLYISAEIPLEYGDKTVTEKLLQKTKAWQPSFHLSSEGIIELPFLPSMPTLLPFRWCNITGSLTKTFTIDGQSTVLPVCNARVHICEIDKIYIWWNKIPEWVIYDLRDRLIDAVIKNPIPIPEPGPIPVPPPGPLVSRFEKISRPLSSLKTNYLRSNKLSAAPITGSLPLSVESGLLSTSLPVVRETIFNNFSLFHPWICLWPWYWPWFYHCDEIAVVNTDCNGRFDHNMFYWLTGDHPDIYIWVEVFDGNNWITVYRPYVACHTYWNYACNTDINIRITDPRVKPCVCDPLEGAIVWMKRINTGASMRRVQQNESASAHLSNAVGLTSFVTGDNVSPFGGGFPFVVQFGSGFPNSTVTHYRWKYKKLKDAFLTNVVDSSHNMEGIIDKSYTYEVSTPQGTVFATGALNLGPTYDSGNPKYRIPHVEASDDVPIPTAEWDQDTYSINVYSPDFTDGLYEFTFELLDATGAVVPTAANTFVVDRIASDPAGPSTIIADGLSENYVVKNMGGQAIAFKFKLRIDNKVCYADVLDAIVDGNSTDTICGIGQYNNKVNDKATLKFLAGHPNNFATYIFQVTKGNSNNVPVANSYSGAPSENYVTQVSNGYSVTTIFDSGVPKNQYEKEMNVSDLLGTCTMAAFAEVLNVHATHTNGSTRLNGYDAGDVAAIAIAHI